MGEEKVSVSRIEALRQALRMEFLKISPKAGDVVVVRPSDGSLELVQQYAEFIIDSLKRVVPPGVNVIVFPHQQLSIEVRRDN
jgi:hypothetical protein